MEDKKQIKMSLTTFIIMVIILVILIIGLAYLILEKIKDNNSSINANNNIAENIRDNDNTVENVEDGNSDKNVNDEKVTYEKETKTSIKEDESKPCVYKRKSYEVNIPIFHYEGTVDEYKGNIKIPYINIKTEEIDKINKELLKIYQEAVDSIEVYEPTKGGGGYYNRLDYEYSIIEEKFLSICITDEKIYVPGGMFPYEKKIYNIDLNNGNILSTKEVIDRIAITEYTLQNKIEQALRKYYYSNVYGSTTLEDDLNSYLESCEYDISEIYFETKERAYIMVKNHMHLLEDEFVEINLDDD